MLKIILIFMAFACIHSITVSRRFKRLCEKAFGAVFMRAWYRLLYNAVSGVTALLAFWLISRVPDQHLWTAPTLLRWAMHAVQLAAVIFALKAFDHLDAGEFMGLRQAWRYVTRQETAGNIEGMAERGLVTTGVYGIVRHPLYVAGILIVTCSPVITKNGLLVTVLADLYFLFGMFIEERRFLRIFGEQYRQYMRQVPRMVPKLTFPATGP